MIRQYGNWLNAKTLLDQIMEPTITHSGENEKHVEIPLPEILGYPVTYYRHEGKKGIKSWAFIINPLTNSAHQKIFSTYADREDKKQLFD